MPKSKVSIDAGAISDKWARNTGNAVNDVVAAVDRVTENPAEKALAKKEKMVQNFNTAMSNGKYDSSMSKVTLTDWKTKTKEKVAARLASGVQAALPKRRAFDQHNVQVLNAILPEIAAMPDMTLQDQANKCMRLWQHMRDNSYKGS